MTSSGDFGVSGSIGAGLMHPSYPLQVVGPRAASYVSKISNTAGDVNAGGLWIHAGDTTTTSSPMPLIVQSFNGTTQFYIRQDGQYFHRAGAVSTADSKRDISELSESAIDLLKDIRIVSYNYKDDTDDRTSRIGFIADDTTNQPQIDGRLTNGGKGFDVQTIVGALIKTIQELNQRIEDLESKD